MSKIFIALSASLLIVCFQSCDQNTAIGSQGALNIGEAPQPQDLGAEQQQEDGGEEAAKEAPTAAPESCKDQSHICMVGRMGQYLMLKSGGSGHSRNSHVCMAAASCANVVGQYLDVKFAINLSKSLCKCQSAKSDDDDDDDDDHRNVVHLSAGELKVLLESSEKK